ncbi:protein PIN-LIKES 3-like isoform X1 [Juglans microcarpa x Juglans regia]|uniref:protein PIN-LIKES 3-like isoform X1 n=2 Tax=Juglans microcarpa x Juglans regia TaxID=2249226 RepID=UPI001B7EA70C|nr:protein PIN-LIKES 3-like isoform X1 [Juglans microcarpa x Juglans regia]XP_040995489.1 protein PIN-LIKES 3-like isoform X1 [Juglans microcarpa x Juglans regia]
MEFLALFIVALMPVLQILLITAFGLFLGTERINLLGAISRPSLNKLVFFVFSPSLIVSNLADTITLDSLGTLWFMVVNVLITFLIGSALAWILVKITRAPQHLHSLIIGCCAAGNLGNLLLIILPAVCEEDDSPFGDSSVCSTDAEAYAALSMALGAIYIWSYVYPIMRIYANKATKDTGTHGSTTRDNISGETSYLHSEIGTEPLLPSEGCPSSEECMDQVEIHSTGSEGKAKVMFLEKTMLHLKKLTGLVDLKKLFAPSTIAAIFGFVIGIVSPIRKVLIGDDAPLRAIYNSVSLLGEATIPSMTLIIGANLLRGLKGARVSPSLIVGIIAIRYIIMPSLGIGIVKAANYFGMVGSDSLYQFTLMLQYALPPAMNVGTISQLLETGESECSVIMLWTYALATFSLTLWSTIFMWLVS